MLNYDNFFLGVNDLNEAKKYYKDILGLKTKFDFHSKGLVAFNIGNNEPAIILKDKNKFPNVKPTIWFVVKNVKLEYEKLLKKGVKFLLNGEMIYEKMYFMWYANE